MNDELGHRMKEQYEDRTRYSLPRRTYTIIRLDGKAFHTLTKGFKRPFDQQLMDMMDKTAIALCEGIQGVTLAYTQSDEISLLLTDFANIQTNAWFDGNIQKIVSISASIATLAFNKEFSRLALENYLLGGFKYNPTFYDKKDEVKQAFFDSRVFTIPDPTEVENYFIWRQADAVRNSIQMAAQSVYSQKELHGKSCGQLQEMLFQKGINWNDYKSGEKRGRAIVKAQYNVEVPDTGISGVREVTRNKWISLPGIEASNETPSFTQDRTFLRSRIPLIGVTNDK